MDETTDDCHRHVANFLVGKLTEDDPGTPYLIASKVLEKTNQSTVAWLVNDTPILLWQGGKENEFVVLLSDAAPYMIKAGSSLNIFYPKLIHFTCLVHGINRVVEVITQFLPDVNSVISNTKKVLLKAPLIVNTYKEKLSGVPMPPQLLSFDG